MSLTFDDVVTLIFIIFVFCFDKMQSRTYTFYRKDMSYQIHEYRTTLAERGSLCLCHSHILMLNLEKLYTIHYQSAWMLLKLAKLNQDPLQL